jgi:hypothetical protein
VLASAFRADWALLLTMAAEMTARWMAHVWGKPLTTVRDERAAQQHPIDTTVELVKDNEQSGHVIRDGRWRVFRDPDDSRGLWSITGPGIPLGGRMFGVPTLARAKEWVAEQLEAEALDANRKRRGHITRQLKAELQKVIADGHD